MIYALLAHEFLVLYPINPATSARYRQAFTTSRAKDDPDDAEICLELLRHHRDRLRPWRAEDAPTRELRQLLEKRLEAIAPMQPLTTDPAVLEPARLSITMLARQLLALRPAIAAFEQRIAELYAAHPDRAIFDSLPGAGPALGPRLLAAFGSDRGRFESAASIQQYSGIAPVTERSGKSTWVHRRWSRPKFVHQSFFEYAGQSALHCPWARAFLSDQKARGKTHPTAVRALAFKWQRILFVCWRERKPYDEAIYLQSLKTRGSHLLAKLESTQPKAA